MEITRARMDSTLNMLRSGQIRVTALSDEAGRCFLKQLDQSLRSFLRELPLCNNLGEYISRKMQRDPGYFADFDTPPLLITLQNQLVGWGKADFSASFDVVQCLLMHGECPNEPMIYDDTGLQSTAWRYFATEALPGGAEKPQERFSMILEAGIFTLLMHHEANPNALVEFDISDHFVLGPFWIAWLLLLTMLQDLWRHSESYTRVLKAAFEGHADCALFTSTSIVTSTSIIARDKGEARETSISLWQLFDIRMSMYPQNQKWADPRARDFLARVMIELARFAGDALPWDRILPSLREICSQTQLHQVLQAIGKEEEQHRVKLRRGYKRAVTGPDSSDVTKRRRLDSPSA